MRSKEHQSSPLRGLIFIGDAIEEPPHEVINLAGQCGLRTLPLFLFQEGLNPTVEDILPAHGPLILRRLCPL